MSLLKLDRIVRAAAALLLIVGLSMPSAVPAAPAAGHALTGVWTGSYSYSDRRAPVRFLMVLRQNAGGTFTGSLREPNTFGTSDVPFLGASISGTVASSGVKFTKTYDGTGGQNHSVAYTGVVNWTTRTVQGTWSLQGSSGTFRMADHN